MFCGCEMVCCPTLQDVHSLGNWWELKFCLPLGISLLLQF